MPGHRSALDWAAQPTAYGRQFGDVYDALFPAGEDAEQAADFLGALGGRDGRFVELGVGTGRVALPLVARGRSVVGVDLSRELLARAAARATELGLPLELVAADIREWRSPAPVDVAYCVCATLSMLAEPAEHRQVLANLAASVRPGGHVVVETHSPERVRRLHAGGGPVEFRTPLAGSADGLASVSELVDRHWTVSYRWPGDPPRTAVEHSRLIEPAELTELAGAVGLRPVRVVSSWTGDPLDPLSPTYVAVFRA
jgi:SAM-dependent methyltransferase